MRPVTDFLIDAHIPESAWLLYEAIITLDSEVEHFWKSKLTGASTVYLMNKYTAVASCVMICVRFLPNLEHKVWMCAINPTISRPYTVSEVRAHYCTRPNDSRKYLSCDIVQYALVVMQILQLVPFVGECRMFSELAPGLSLTLYASVLHPTDICFQQELVPVSTCSVIVTRTTSSQYGEFG